MTTFYPGNTAEASQRICVLNNLSGLEAAINGIKESDMKNDPEE